MKLHYLVALALWGLAWPVHSDTAAQTLEYQSAFEGYQAYSDLEIQNWPTMNELVDEIGGWRVYAREPYENSESPAQPKEEMPVQQKNGGVQ